uniref:Uncharacterized protein n=1 Tax=Arundo donax TaxID=35708 RepID=A0A0A8Z860_ARUDO
MIWNFQTPIITLLNTSATLEYLYSDESKAT